MYKQLMFSHSWRLLLNHNTNVLIENTTIPSSTVLSPKSMHNVHALCQMSEFVDISVETPWALLSCLKLSLIKK